MNNKYDVIIIGAGPSGIFCAYTLIQENPGLKILMIEKGRAIENRSCPKRRTQNAWAAARVRSPQDLRGRELFRWETVASPDVGGNLPEILGYEKTVQLLKESDDIYLKFGGRQ